MKVAIEADEFIEQVGLHEHILSLLHTFGNASDKRYLQLITIASIARFFRENWPKLVPDPVDNVPASDHRVARAFRQYYHTDPEVRASYTRYVARFL